MTPPSSDRAPRPCDRHRARHVQPGASPRTPARVPRAPDDGARRLGARRRRRRQQGRHREGARAVDGSGDAAPAVPRAGQRRAVRRPPQRHPAHRGRAHHRHRRRHGGLSGVRAKSTSRPSRRHPGETVVIGKVVPEKTFMKKPLFTAVGEHHLLLLHARLERGEQPADGDRVRDAERLVPPGALPRAWAASTPPCGSTRTANSASAWSGQAQVRLRARALGHPPLGRRLVREVVAPALRVRQVRAAGLGEARRERPASPASQLRRRQPPQPRARSARLRGRRRSKLAESALRWIGNALQRLEILEPAIYTHKAIQAVRYHQGLRDALGLVGRRCGAWSGSTSRRPERPRKPTGSGLTYEGSTPST